MIEQYPAYSGNDLGMQYTKNHTSFRLWAPTADRVTLRIYPDGDRSLCLARFLMTPGEGGTWCCRIEGDLQGRYYTYQVSRKNRRLPETADPYGRAVGVNGKRSMIVDLRQTDPEGFAQDHGPKTKSMTDLIIAELSVVDATSDPACHAKYPASFLGLTEEKLLTDEGNPCGLDYFAGLGITHVQLMPIYDFATVDESLPVGKRGYNWGYDPQNYNVPEGSFSQDPQHGEVRIRECKAMIQAFHQKGIGVIMDVVYNHVYQVDRSPLGRTVPGYFFRSQDGKLSNGSGCGNEIASERAMVRKYIIDSLCYWVQEYHVDGFRFDLMGIFDLETIQQAGKALRQIRPDIILYGEGWAGGMCAYPEEKRCVKANLAKIPGTGAFSDNIRDHIRGSVFSASDRGFATGKKAEEMEIMFAVTAGIHHPQTELYTKDWHWAGAPDQVINYLACHDNLTLWDKLTLSCPELTQEERIRRNCLSAAILFTAQGAAFFPAGEEIARSKPYPDGKGLCENSYNQPASVNTIRYDRLSEYGELYDYYRGMIAFRKAHPALRLRTAEEIAGQLHFLEKLPQQTVGFTVENGQEKLLIVYNAGEKEFYLPLKEGEHWGICVYGTKASADVIGEISGGVRVEAHSALAAVLLNR